jgi:hypothetical protein
MLLMLTQEIKRDINVKTAADSAHYKARHYLPENEPAPISETDYGIPTSSSTFKLNPSPASLLPAIYKASKICKWTTMLQKMMKINLENP